MISRGKTKMKRTIMCIVIFILFVAPVVIASNPSEPSLSIEFFTGPFTGAIIKNIGTTEANNIVWNLSAKGGFLRKIDVSQQGFIATLPPGGYVGDTIRLQPMPHGFGRVTITISAQASNAAPVEEQIRTFLVWYYTIQLPG